MKRVWLAVVGALMVAGPAQAQRPTEQERRELEARLEQLRQEMQDLERQLGRERIRGLLTETPMAFAIGFGRPRLGVIVQTERNAATDSVGALLQAVTPDGPAAQAGLQANDVIVRFNGQALAGTVGDATPGDRLIELARELKEGDTVRVQYRRDGATRTAAIVPRKMDDNTFAYRLRSPDSSMVLLRELTDRMREPLAIQRRIDPQVWVGFGSRWSDMELTTLDADLGAYFGTTEGLLVVRAPKDSLLGLKSGDVILRIGGRVPSSPSHAVRILRSYEPGDQVRIELMRSRRRTEVTATVPERERGLYWEERFE